MFEIEFTPEALDDLEALKKSDQVLIIDAIETQLRHEPLVETRNRKQLRPNQVAGWELRVGRLRILYNVYQDIPVVSVEAIGFKIGNMLFIRGRRRDL